MKYPFLSAVLCCCITSTSAQKIDTLKHLFRISAGLTYYDGYSPRQMAPGFGLSYQYHFRRRWALAANLFWTYDSPPLSPYGDKREPDIDLFRTSVSPFLTDADLEKISNPGYIGLHAYRPAHSFSMPIDVGVVYYPIIFRGHSLATNLGFSMSYESRTAFWRDKLPTYFKPNDASEPVIITLSPNIEYRNFSPGLTLKFMYTYRFKNNVLLGVRTGSYNFFLDFIFNRVNEIIWERSLFIGYKF